VFLFMGAVFVDFLEFLGELLEVLFDVGAVVVYGFFVHGIWSLLADVLTCRVL